MLADYVISGLASMCDPPSLMFVVCMEPSTDESSVTKEQCVVFLPMPPTLVIHAVLRARSYLSSVRALSITRCLGNIADLTSAARDSVEIPHNHLPTLKPIIKQQLVRSKKRAHHISHGIFLLGSATLTRERRHLLSSRSYKALHR